MEKGTPVAKPVPSTSHVAIGFRSWLQKSMPGTRPSTQTVSPVIVQLLHATFVVRLLDFLTWFPALLHFPILITFCTLKFVEILNSDLFFIGHKTEEKIVIES
ncbi:hypothetical protein V8G54_020950 [Vigna mungo]|uniref:Transmembrane protein n=1 Tax=Vigna mungo TaxID=3915 RepID=A0AAQ3NCQ8_VIGMU